MSSAASTAEKQAMYLPACVAVGVHVNSALTGFTPIAPACRHSGHLISFARQNMPSHSRAHKLSSLATSLSLILSFFLFLSVCLYNLTQPLIYQQPQVETHRLAETAPTPPAATP